VKTLRYLGLLLALTAWLGPASAVAVDEPLEGIQADAAPPPLPGFEQAHGLLAKRQLRPLSAERIARQEDGPQKKPPLPPETLPFVEKANWEMIGGAGFTSPPPIETPVENWGSCGCCPHPLWCHRSGAFFDLLYLRPGNIDYIYAVEQTGTLPTDSPTGPVGRVGFDSELGYRFGFNCALTDCSSIQASYAWFQDGTNDTIAATPGTVLIFQPGLPSIPNVGAASNQATARYDIRFQQIDIDYRGLLYGTCNSAVNYFAGLRYANLDQRFTAEENVGVPIGFSTVATEIDFDGFGIGFGLDGVRRSPYTGLLVYGRASSSFVAGEFKADFRQTAQFGPNVVLGNTLADYRVMTILQTEIGAGWQDESGVLRATLGYQVAGWFNALTTSSYIPGVQNRRFDDLNETITFDGVVGRLEVRF
jgi:hypothetical protein